jgi:5-methylcytosine-specific restriction endonuclease McrA
MARSLEATFNQSVWKRADDCCEYCRMPQQYDDLPFQIDHILARQHGGPTTLSNTGLACMACNKFKGPNIASIDGATR